MILDASTVVQPDIVLIRSERRSIIGEKNIVGAPDVLIEILSPSTRRQDTKTKKSLYARFRVPHYWVVDPDASSIERYRLEADTYVLVELAASPSVIRPSELDGLEIPLAIVFRE